MKRATPLLAWLLLLTGANGPIWLVEAQVVAVFAMPGVATESTAVVTLNGTFYVRERPAEVARVLDASLAKTKSP